MSFYKAWSFSEKLVQLKHFVLEALDFRSRIWVIRISESRLKDESFIINEDSFQEPLQWMKRRHYSLSMLEQVEICSVPKFEPSKSVNKRIVYLESNRVIYLAFCIVFLDA